MRVLHVARITGLAGCERQLLSVLPGLAEQAVDVAMCVLQGAGPTHRFLDPLQRAGIPAVVVRAGPHVNPAMVPRLVGVLRRFRPDLVHTHIIHGDLYGQVAARLRGLPAVSTVHSTLDYYVRQPYRSVTRLAGHLAGRTIAISRHVAAFVRREHVAPEDRIRIVPYGVEVDAWSVSPEEVQTARAGFGFQPDEVVVGMASRLVPNKGHAFALEALSKAITRAPALRLAIAGDGSLATELRAMAESRLPPGHVRFYGFLPDVRSFMAACDVVVFPTSPSLSEGFGLAALEASAAGRPVLVTRVGSLPEVVSDGETGYVVDEGDPADLSARLVTLAGDPALRGRLGASGREWARSQFGIDKSVRGIRSVYEEVA